MTTEVERKLLTINETAELLSMGRSLVYTLVNTGEIKSIKIGRSRRIPVDALDEFVAKRLKEKV